jgi:hypothetical protein
MKAITKIRAFRLKLGMPRAEIRTRNEELNMRYTQPRITGTYRADSTIKGEKGTRRLEINQVALTASPAYECDE